MRKITYEPMRPKKVLNSVKAPSMPFDWSLNPYRGCQHGCSFCYARSTHAFIGESADDAFQNHIFWKQDAPTILRADLKRMARRLPTHVQIGTATDPYQQLEGKEMLTRRCLEVLAEFGVPAAVTTRSPLVLRDLDLLQQMPGSSVNFSVHTLNPDIWRTFEPSTPAPRLRLDSVRKLNEAGVRAGVFMAPILPFLSDDEDSAEVLFSACAEAGAAYVMPSILRLATPEVKSWFFSVLRESYPELTEKYGQLYWRSGYVPDSFKRPLLDRIHKQLAAHKLNEFTGDPDKYREKVMAPQPAVQTPDSCAPIQLTLF